MGTAVRDVIDFLTNPAIDMENTVDHLLFGDPESIVRGIATTFVATQEAIDQAVLLGVNLLVSLGWQDFEVDRRLGVLVVLGHAESEMPGMSRLATRLQKSFSDIPVHFIPQKPVFQLS